MTFTQLGSSPHTLPFLYVINTVVMVHDNCFIGHATLTGTTCTQDAILLGSASPPTTIVSIPDSRFQGYGTVIRQNQFNRVRRAVWGRRASNGVVVSDNTIWNACGTDGGSAAASAAAIDFQGVSVSSTVGVVITGNLIEICSYYYGIRMGDYTASFTVVGNNFYDPGSMVTAYVKCSPTQSAYHLIMAGLLPRHLPVRGRHRRVEHGLHPPSVAVLDHADAGDLPGQHDSRRAAGGRQRRVRRRRCGDEDSASGRPVGERGAAHRAPVRR
jgi:hypothetical protein